MEVRVWLDVKEDVVLHVLAVVEAVVVATAVEIALAHVVGAVLLPVLEAVQEEPYLLHTNDTN